MKTPLSSKTAVLCLAQGILAIYFGRLIVDITQFGRVTYGEDIAHGGFPELSCLLGFPPHTGQSIALGVIAISIIQNLLVRAERTRLIIDFAIFSTLFLILVFAWYAVFVSRFLYDMKGD